MGDIITPEYFDEIYDRICWIGKLKKELSFFKAPLNEFLFNKFICENTYKVFYEEEEYYILTDAYCSNIENTNSDTFYCNSCFGIFLTDDRLNGELFCRKCSS